MMRCVPVIIIVCLLPMFAQSQNIYSTPYSVYGIGTINSRMSSFNRSIGGVGIGVQDDYNINPVNPASYGAISSPVTHIYEAGFYVEANRYQTSTRTESKSTGGITNLNYWFKFSKWWASSVGLTPYSSVAYSISTTRELGAASKVNYLYTGSGNLNQLYLGNGFTITDNLSLGVNLTYIFGSLHKTESIDIASESGTLTYDNQLVARKLDVDFGLQYKINIGKRALILGVVADDGVTFKASQSSTLYNYNRDTLSTATGKDITYKLPASAGFGLSLRSSRSILAADLRYENWKNAKFGQQETIFQDTWKFAAGYVYKGNPSAESYLGLASLRTGFYVQNYQQKMKGVQFPVWGFSAGVSLPMFDGKSAVNLTYSYDTMGSTQNQLLLQRSQKIMIDVVIRDLWGIRRKFD